MSNALNYKKVYIKYFDIILVINSMPKTLITIINILWYFYLTT